MVTRIGSAAGLGIREKQLPWSLFQSKTEMECFELPIRTRHRYLINPGSVGQPRDGDWRAAFAIYDDEQSKLIWYRVPYKVHIAQRRIRGVGLPDSLADRLKEGR